jgi:hypothetical protein
MRFHVLTVAGTNLAIVWVVAPCNLAEAHRRFRGAQMTARIYKIGNHVTMRMKTYTRRK